MVMFVWGLPTLSNTVTVRNQETCSSEFPMIDALEVSMTVAVRNRSEFDSSTVGPIDVTVELTIHPEEETRLIPVSMTFEIVRPEA